jgi:hypothetical protein
MNFGVKEFIIKKTLKKKTLMFEHYNLMDSMKRGATKILGLFVRRRCEDPTITYSSIHTLIF